MNSVLVEVRKPSLWFQGKKECVVLHDQAMLGTLCSHEPPCISFILESFDALPYRNQCWTC